MTSGKFKVEVRTKDGDWRTVWFKVEVRTKDGDWRTVGHSSIRELAEAKARQAMGISSNHVDYRITEV